MENIVFTLVERGFFWNGVRNLFSALDYVAFWLFSKVMGLMFDIANLTASKGAEITEFLKPIQDRIYVILSIYMVFKVTISLITYIVNPDAMTDKNQGAGKLVQRIIVSLIMIIFFPVAFDTANEFQSHIIENNTIPKIVLGISGSVNSTEGIGNEIAYEVYNGTFIYDNESGGKISASPETVDSLIELINDPVEGNGTVYKYGYIPFAGFAVGMLLTVLTLSMCVDVAVRVFKLIILQMVAPIPIISYMDPKQAKDGAFSKWIKLTISVWTEVFIRLFVIYFILLVIESLISNGGALVSGTNIFVKIALIIGLLFFAKDAPKFICEAIGIKDVPKGGLFGGLGSIMAAGAIVGGAFGAGVGIARSGFSADKAKGNLGFGSGVKNIGAGLFGALGGLATGAWSAGTAKDHQAKAVMEARNKYLANQLAGNTLGYRAKSTLSNLLLGGNDSSAMDRQIAGYDDAFNKFKNLKSTAFDKMSENANFRRTISFDHNGTSIELNNANFKELNQQLDRANNGDTAAQNWFQTNYGVDYQTVALHMNDIGDDFTSQYIASNEVDGTTLGAAEYAMSAAKDIGYNLDLSDGDRAMSSIKYGMKVSSEGTRKIKTSDDYKKQHSGGKKQ